MVSFTEKAPVRATGKVSEMVQTRQVENCGAAILRLTDLLRVWGTSTVAAKASTVAAEATAVAAEAPAVTTKAPAVTTEAPAVDTTVSIAVGVLVAIAVAVGEVAVGVGEAVALRNTHDAQAPVLI